MGPETIFQYANLFGLFGWVLLLLAPFTKVTTKIVQWGVVPLLLGVLYAYLVIRFFGDAEGDFSSLNGVASLFKNDYALLAGWIHYLAFDLWIGCWEIGDAKKHGINRWLVVPCLFFTLMYGPVGLLLYIALRAIITKKLVHENF